MQSGRQHDLLLDSGPDVELDAATTRRGLDELFSLTGQYKTTQSFDNLLKFVANFRFYAPYNAMLVHIQMTGAKYVCSPTRWMDEFKRQIKPGARPLVILQPMGPVMFVFDVADTIALPGAPPLPKEVESPFEVRGGRVGDQLEKTVENSIRDGVAITRQHAGSQSAGQIGAATAGRSLHYQTRIRPKPEFIEVPLRYELLLNSTHSREAQYATLVHELAHLYCGHIGSPNPQWWPDRRHLNHDRNLCEFEAESVCYLVCRRLGIDNPSEEYLAGYLKNNTEVPAISLEAVMVTANLIEKMGRERFKPRKEAKK
jgi:hypothetical protein